jgi:hypothetical protein
MVTTLMSDETVLETEDFTVLYFNRKYSEYTAGAFLHRVCEVLKCDVSTHDLQPRTFILHTDVTREELDAILVNARYEFHRVKGAHNPKLPFAIKQTA